jgi:hypothetical protein
VIPNDSAPGNFGPYPYNGPSQRPAYQRKDQSVENKIKFLEYINDLPMMNKARNPGNSARIAFIVVFSDLINVMCFGFDQLGSLLHHSVLRVLRHTTSTRLRLEKSASHLLIDGEAVEPAGASCANQGLPGAPPARMRCIPRRIPAAEPVRVAEQTSRLPRRSDLRCRNRFCCALTK